MYYFCNISKQIHDKYKIKDENETINFIKACEFVKDVFKAGWEHPFGFRDRAVRMRYANKIIMGTKKETWVISYKNIYTMMNDQTPYYRTTPVYKKRHGGFIYGKK